MDRLAILYACFWLMFFFNSLEPCHFFALFFFGRGLIILKHIFLKHIALFLHHICLFFNFGLAKTLTHLSWNTAKIKSLSLVKIVKEVLIILKLYLFFLAIHNDDHFIWIRLLLGLELQFDYLYKIIDIVYLLISQWSLSICPCIHVLYC